MIKKLLLVDDSPFARKIMRKCLPAGQQFEIHEASDGAVGVDKFNEIKPDLTLLDLTMPVMDGIEALEKMKEIDANAVIIIATADVQTKTVLKVMGLGALLVLKKPPSVESVQMAFIKAEKALNKLGDL